MQRGVPLVPVGSAVAVVVEHVAKPNVALAYVAFLVFPVACETDVAVGDLSAVTEGFAAASSTPPKH